jgi:RNA polymerase sigma-70 factor, ECF subfamily
VKERDDLEWLAEQFEQHRSQLRTVAYPMLGSLSDSATRCRRPGCGYADRRAILGNLGAWLTTSRPTPHQQPKTRL